MQIVVPENGSSVSVKDFDKAASESLKQHVESLDEKTRKASKDGIAQLEDAIAAAKTLVKSGHFGQDHVYAVISSGRNEGFNQVGSGYIVDVRIESRAEPQPVAAPGPTRSAREQEIREAQERAYALAATPYAENSRAEDQVAKAPPIGAAHTIVPPATGPTPYMPERAENAASRAPVGDFPDATPDATRKAREQSERAAKKTSKRTSKAQRRAAKQAKANTTANATTTAILPVPARTTRTRAAKSNA